MTKVVFGDERHGIRMDGDTHAYLHLTQGTKYSSGAQINGLTTGGTTYSNIASGVFFDEDIRHLPQAQINLPFWYRTTTWNVTPDANLLGYKTTGNIFYNPFTTSWNLTEVQTNRYCLVHIYFTNDAQFPYVKILGQQQYLNKNDAKVGASTELKKLALDGLPTLEFKVLYSIILSHTGALQLTDEGEQYIDWRQSITSSSGTSPDDTFQNRAELELQFKTIFSTAYSELTYNGADISEINIWDTNLKGTILFTKSLTYLNGNITQIDIIDHLQGVTLTKELSYNMGNIISINKTIN